jgi:hypothetical protein
MWNKACIANPIAGNTILTAFERARGVEMTFPKDCPTVVTDAAVGHCSCTGALLLTSGERIRFRYISRALHKSRTELLLRATGEWLWFMTEFQEWRDLPGHPLLWLCGSPGSGKSILTSAVIKHLEGDRRNDEVVAFYCCDGRYESSNTILNIMGAWLAELQAQRTRHSVVARLMEDVVDLESSDGQLSRATLRDLFQMIKHNLKENETLILVLDGLDDVQMEHEMLRELLLLTSQHGKQHSIKIFLSSRGDNTTESDITTPFKISMDTQSSIVDDIKDYTDSITSHGLVSYDTVMAIHKVTEKSEGRFLCLRLLLLILPNKPSSASLNEWLVKVTGDAGISGPFTIYSYMYQSILERHRLFAFYMLRWVLHAARPMYSWELLGTVNSELGTDYTDADVEKATGGLLVLSTTRTVNLVHSTLRGYLMNIEWSSLPEKPHIVQEMIVRACLKALNPTDILQSLNQPWLDNHTLDTRPKLPQTLEIYAKAYWIHHYLLAEPQSSCTSGLLHETLRRVLATNKARSPDDTESEPKAPKTLLEIETARLQPSSLGTINMTLRISTSYGFYKLAKLELDMGATDHVISTFPENSLHLAAMAGHARLVKLLIDYGADINSRCALGETPLFHGIASGDDKVVELLLKTGLPPAATAQTYKTMEELTLRPKISEQCHICGERKISFIVGFTYSYVNNKQGFARLIAKAKTMKTESNYELDNEDIAQCAR